LTPDDFYEIVLEASVPLVVAESGKPLRWVDWSEYYTFFWRDAQPHIATSEASSPECFPDGYCYVASEWSAVEDGESVILLEMYRKDIPVPCDEAARDQPSSEVQTQHGLSILERDFCLGLYVCFRQA
jgi:hypothetical protein